MNGEAAPVNSLQGFLERVERLSASWYPLVVGEPWFRGTAHPLQPGAVWAGVSDELAAQHEFIARAGGMITREPADEWEWYFLLQHYGMATRLLDWTTNPFVALYFALQAAGSARPSVQVWVLDPLKLNLASVGFESVFTPGGELTKHWLPSRLKAGSSQRFEFEGKADCLNAHALAIYPKRRNPRILAQAGTFTIHGTEADPVDEVMGSLPGHERKVARIDIEVTPQRAGELLRQLATLGFSASALFPEPQYLASEIRAKYAQR